MRTPPCVHAHDVREAAVEARWTSELAAHAAACPTCLHVWLRTAALGGPPALPPAVDPTVLWSQAKRARRLRAEAQISRIMTAAHVTSGALILAVLVFFGSQVGWTSLALDGVSRTLLGTGVLIMSLAAVGLSGLISQDV